MVDRERSIEIPRTTEVREYQERDRAVIVKFVEELQDFLIAADPLKRLRRLPEYGEQYVTDLLKKLHDHAGVIFLSETDDVPSGFIAGNIEEQTSNDVLGCISSRSGRILELIVRDEFRGQRIGAALMSRMEEYFRSHGCDIVRVEVFEPNRGARAFYKTSGYGERAIDMVKEIGKT